MQSRLFFYIFWMSTALFSQYSVHRTDIPDPEKVFLQLSSHVFATDETIWFNAVVVNGTDHGITKRSGLLYVDLIDPQGNLVAHRLVELSAGTGQGSFEPYDKQTEGRHLIRAYTQWNRNFGEDFIFKTYVQRVSSNTETKKGLVDSLVITEHSPGKLLLSGALSGMAMNESPEDKLPLYLKWHEGNDSLFVKARGSEALRFEYELPTNTGYISISNGIRAESVVLNPNALDLRFFPESGKLVHGFRNKIAFKATGADGKGKMVKGNILDDNNKRVAHFESNRLGMGILTLFADSLRTYRAKVDFPSGVSDMTVFPLPEVVREGSVLSVTKSGQKVWVRVATNALEKPISIKVSCRGQDYFLIEGPLQNGLLTKALRSDQLPSGIVVFTLFNENGEAVAERLCYNENPNTFLNIGLSTNEAFFQRRGKTEVKVNVENLLPNTEKVRFNVRVINQDFWSKNEINTLQSYFLLDSELKGEVENPNYYFNTENKNRMEDLDALLLTQGWRDYKYPVKRTSNRYYHPQEGLEMNGWVQRPENKKDSLSITLATFGSSPAFYQAPIDSLGRFRFALNNNYGPPIKALLSTAYGSEKNKVAIFLKSNKTPKVIYERKPDLRKPDKVLNATVDAQKERLRIDSVFDSLYGVTQLDEVVVSENRLAPEKARLYELYGKADIIISGDEIREKEKEWSYGLYSILLFNYGDQIEIEKFSDGFMLAHIRGGSREATLVMVDGQLIPKEQYEFVPSMSPDAVESIELIKYAKFFKRRYLSVFPDTDLFQIPSLGHIISIHTKGKVGVHGAKRAAPGTLTTFIEQLSPIKEFYAPKYGIPDTVDRDRPDLRSLVHWTPFFDLDTSRTATLQFYNGDVLGTYVILVEAISENGLMGYAEKSYQVKDERPQGLKR